MKNMSGREKAMLGILGVLCIVLAYYYLVYIPMTTEIENYKQEYVTVDESMIIVEAKVAQMSSMKAEIEAIKAGEVGDIKVLPMHDNRQNLMSQLSMILAKTKSYNIRFGTITADGTTISRQVTLDYICEDYALAKGILQEIYTGQYPCIIGNISVGSNGAAMSMDITYYEHGKLEQAAE